MRDDDTTLNYQDVDLSKYVDIMGEDIVTNQQKSQLSVVMPDAMKRNPQEEAKLQGLSERSKLPIDAVRIDPTAVEQKIKYQDIDINELVTKYPKLTKFMSDPANAAISHNDIANLKELENAITPKPLEEVTGNMFTNLGESLGLSAQGMYQGLKQKFFDSSQKNMDLIRQASGGELPTEQSWFQELVGIPSAAQQDAEIKGYIDATIKEIQAIEKRQGEITPTNLNIFEKGARAGLESMVMNLPGIAATIATRGQSSLPALGTMAVQSYAASYGAARAGGLDARQADYKASIDAIIEVGTEVAPLKILGDIVKGQGKGIANKLRDFALTEMTGEQVATLGQSINEYAFGLDDEINKAEGWQEVLAIQAERQAVTAIATVVAGGTQGGIASAISKIQGAQSEQTKTILKGMREQGVLENINKYSETSELRKNNKEKFKQFMRAAEGENGGKVFIDSAALKKYLTETEGLNPDEPIIAQLIGLVNEAESLGQDVSIPIEDFAADMAGTPHYEALKDAMTMSEDTIAPMQKVQRGKEQVEYVKGIIAEAQESASEYVEAQEIYETVRQQLIDTGMVNPANAKYMADVVPAWATSYAVRQGITVQQAYERSGLLIEGPQTGEAARLAAEEAAIGQTGPVQIEGFINPDAQAFTDSVTTSLGNNPNGNSATIYTPEQYADMDLYTIDEGRAGFAIEKGMLISVFKDPESTVKGFETLVPTAIKAGARELEAFDGVLTENYAKYGFVETGRVPWDDAFAPEGWDYETQGRPDLVSMELQGQQYEQTRETNENEIQDSGRVRAGDGEVRGGLSPLQDAPSVKGINGPIEGLVRVAEQYAADNGIDLQRQSEYVDVDPERATRIAEAYEQMENAPNDPAVREAYENLIEQTMAQYEALVAAGYQFWFVDLSNDDNLEYISSPWNSMRDISQNKQMGVFPTDEGFGTDVAFDASTNPLLADTGIQWPSGSIDGEMKTVYANDLFRAVHDAFGHGMEGAGFRGRGEENAWQAHVRLFTGSAIGAITSETRGQNSWVNYGPSGEQNQTASAEDTVFADQKVGLMPEWTWTEGRAADEVTETAEVEVFRQAQLNGIGLYSGVEGAVLDMNIQNWGNKSTKNKPAVKAIDAQIAQLREERRVEDERLQKAMDALQASENSDQAQLDELDDALSSTATGKQIAELRRQRSAEATPRASGKEIWAKLKKEPGVKAEELQWMGIEDFLLAADEKLSREDVVDFIRENGVMVEEITSESGGPDVNDIDFEWDDGIADMDRENWEGRAEELVMMAREDRGDLFLSARTYIIETQDTYIAENKEADQTDEEYAEEQFASEIDERLEQLADEQAREEYEENPYMTYDMTMTDASGNIVGEDITVTASGNDDIGYTVVSEGNVIADGVYSLSEAGIQAQDYLRDNDELRGETSGGAKWEEYVTEGDFENYREIKLTLPEISPEFYNTVHFDEPNIVAFLRVTDRELRVTDEAIEDDVVFKDTYFVDEFQSDWHQDGRQKGYRDPSLDIVATETDSMNVEGRIIDTFIPLIPFLERTLTQNNEMEVEASTGVDSILVSSMNDRGANIIYSKDGMHWKGLRAFADSEYADEDFKSKVDELEALIDERTKIQEAIRAFDSGVPDAPFKGNAWLNLGLKRALVDAVDQDKDAFAWADANVLSDRWSERYRKLYEMQYDVKMTSAIKKLTKQTPVHLNMDGSAHTEGELGYWTIPLTPELKETIKVDSYPLFQNQGVTKGYYSPSESLIRLTEAADETTFLHEFAHFMYEMELTASRDNPGKENHIASINNWYKRNGEEVLKEAAEYAPNTTIIQRHLEDFLDKGTTGDKERDDAIRRAVHEQFARGFEKYLMEGKAPSVELRNAFRTFARWMLQVYQAAKGMFNPNEINLDDGIRQIYDRLLATDEQIAAAEARAEYAPMFTDAAMAGMTEEEFENYKAKQEKVKEKQTETLRDKVIAQLTRMTKTWWKDEMQDEVDAQTDTLQNEQVYLTRDGLKNGEVKLDHATVKDMVGEDVTNKRGIKSHRIPTKLNGMTAKGGEGLHPDEAAALFGYDSGAEMLADLQEAPPIEQVAKAQADVAMKERHGDILNDGTIAREADEAIMNAERGALLLLELKALSKGSRTPTIDRATMKFEAEANIAKLSFKDIHPGKYRKAEIKAAQESATLLANGDREGAKNAKTRQLMNFYLNKAATEARADVLRRVEGMARYNKKAVRERIMRAENGYWEQVVKVLQRFEFRKAASLKGVDAKNQAIEAWMNERIDTDGDGLMLTPEVLDELYTTHWKNVPYSELKGITDSVKNIEHVARYADKMRVLGEEITFKKLVNKWVTHINDKNTKGDKFKSQRTDVKEGRSWGRMAMAQMTKIPFLARWLDGGENGGLSFDIMSQPFTDAYSAEVDLMAEHGEPVMKLIENRSKADQKRHAQKVFIPELKDENNNGNLYGNQIVSVALNVGNAGNLRKMLLGEGWANKDDPDSISIDNPQLQAVLGRMSQSDWELVQAIWDAMDALYPQLAEVHRKTTGLTPPKVEATSIETPYGTFRGGYFPVKYDSNRSQKAQDNEDKLNAQTESMFSTTSSIQANVTAGATNERTEYYAPIRLSLDVVPSHFQETIHFITHHDAVRQMNKLLRNPQVSKAISESMGPEEFAQLKPWLNDIAKDGREASTKLWWEDALARLRFGTTLASMGFSASTGLLQFLGWSNIAAEVGPKYTYQAVKQILGSPAKMAEAWDFASSNSKILNSRMTSMDREIKNAMNRINTVQASTGRPVRDAFARFDNSNILKGLQEASMKHIGYVQTYMVDLPTWYAAYIKELELSGDEAKAIRVADFTVESIQGSGLTKDLPTILRTRNEANRMFTMFMTFFSALWNMERDLVKGAKAGNYSTTQTAAKLMFLFTIPVAIEMLVRGEFGAEDDEPEDKLQKYLLKTALYSAASVPFARDIASGIGGEFGYTMTPLAGVLERGIGSSKAMTDNAISDGDITMSQAKNSSKFIGTALGIPGTGQVWKTTEHLYEVLEEGEDLTARELLLGPDREKK